MKYRKLSQLAIALMIGQPGFTVALCGARKVANTVENAGAALTRRDAEAIAPIASAV